MKFITTTRCEQQLLNDHYLYSKNKAGDGGNIYWECVERMSGNGRCQHTHPLNSKLTAVKKIRTNMKKDARNADLTTKYSILANIVGGN